MSFTDFAEGALINEMLGGVEYAQPATVHAALHAVWPTEAGVGTELSNIGYARTAITNNTTNWPNFSGGQKLNANPIAFGPAGENWVQAVAMALWDASPGGNMLARCWLGPDPPRIFTARSTDEILTAPGHGMVNDDRAAVLADPLGTLPTGVAEGTLYWVVGVSGDTFQLSLTQGGAAINLTTAGSGQIKKVVPKTVANGETLTFPASSVVFTFD